MNVSGFAFGKNRVFALQMVQEGMEPEASGVNVRKTMQALEAAKLSIANGQVIVMKDM